MSGKVVRWHRIPFGQFVAHEASRPMFRPFLYGAAVSFVLFGLLPARNATQEAKENSKYWQRVNDKFDYSHH
ncbi:hypothetical protein Poli38472_001342 [Pythium oligandrum]|uniref:Uncharacterized protein n=1 Tax=Pythium oligandrum TaxID=41045 RepID=A0A8K1CSS6_PYTOL|nr:hypothetical protein Poli38472_001342 [Pythium oligandrum]|eukprot:TMW69186.1 hypothetical protein Poli38472_001342 [Pythium oligandrum]